VTIWFWFCALNANDENQLSAVNFNSSSHSVSDMKVSSIVPSIHTISGRTIAAKKYEMSASHFQACNDIYIARHSPNINDH
jgi:hypothetical protein